MSDLEAATLRVLLVNDDQAHVIIIRRAIRAVAPRMTVDTVADSAEALALLRAPEPAQRPDLILLDINMPGLSGFEVLKMVKEKPGLRHIPVVMLTSSELPADVARAYELGAGGYISKLSYLCDLRVVLGNTLLYWSTMRRVPAERGL